MRRFTNFILSGNLSIKLITSVAFVLLLGIASFAYLSINLQKQYLISEVIKGAHRFSDTVKRATKYEMLRVQREAVYRIITDIGKQPGIEKVRIFNKEGTIMFSTDKSEIGKPVDKKAEACYACHAAEKPIVRLSTTEKSRIFRSENGHRIIGVIEPIYNEKECYTAPCHAHPKSQNVLGVLDVDMSLGNIDKTIARNQLAIILFAFFAILGVSGIIILFIQRFVDRPVKQLIIGTRRVAEGDLDYLIPIHSNDEMGYLANSFNRMTRNLKKAHEEVNKRAKSLQQKIIELKETQDQLVRSEKLASLGKMAAGIAHEINNPLASVLTYCHYFLRKMPPDDPNRGRMQVMLNETFRCSRIVRGLLDFAREAAPDKTPKDINEIIEHTLSLVVDQAIFHNIKINKQLNHDLPKIMIDENQIQQVFINIMLNAAEASSDGGTLTITTTLDPLDSNLIAIEFTDTGCGIPEENIAKIFDPFFSTKEIGEGTGLGLAVSYGIIEKHNGRIEVKSKQGEGSTFTVKLPIVQEEATITA